MAVEISRQETDWLIREKYAGRADEPSLAEDLARLREGEPLAYVIGFVDFLGCRIDLSRRTLIPRAETEYWVHQAIDDIGRSSKGPLRCLDLFSGSGCIGVALLKHLPGSTVDFGEKENRFLEQIKINLDLNDIPPSRYRIVATDVFSGVAERYDYILANPPYVPESEKVVVQSSVLGFEPRGAVFGGEDGLRFIRSLLEGVSEHLLPGGWFFLEFGAGQKEAVARILKGLGWGAIRFFRDQFGRWRWVSGQDVTIASP